MDLSEIGKGCDKLYIYTIFIRLGLIGCQICILDRDKCCIHNKYREAESKSEIRKEVIMKRQFNVSEIIEGAYYPGVFIIKLKKILHENIEYDDFDNEDWQTFVHEYVHFIQDISTLHGYTYFLHKSQMLNLMIYHIGNIASEEVLLPIYPEDTNINNALEKEILLDFYEGDNDHIHFHHINHIAIEADVISTEMIFGSFEKEKKLYAVNIYYDNLAKPYQFGSTCIIESMAYLIEYYLFGAKIRKNEFPYNACETVCQIVCPDLLKTPKRMMMLAEVSLMHDDCGAFFIGALDFFHKNPDAIQSDQEFEDFCIKNIDSYSDCLDSIYQEALKGIDILFPTHFQYTFVTNMQLKAFLEGGYNYRRQYKHFLSDAFDYTDNKAYFKYLINLFGIPMFVDGKDDCYGKPGTQNIPVADAVLSFLSRNTNGKGCELQTFCKKSRMHCYDPDICSNAPWEQCKSSEICPLAMYLKGYGIDNKKYKWKNR